MYCSKCGKSVKDGLKYCNSCGERLAPDEDKDSSPAKMLDDILETLFWTAILSLGILVGLVAVMLQKDIKTEVVMMIVIAYLAAVFGICFMLARQVPKLIDAKLRVWSDRAENTPPAQLTPATVIAHLDEYRESVMSVTDRTTKTLDKVPTAKN